MTMILRPLTSEDEQQAVLAHQELAAECFPFLLDNPQPDEPWECYVQRLEQLRHNVGVPAGRVPATFLIVEVDGQLVGRTSIRHSLNPYLECWGGHIGYAVRPAFRRHGYATEILRQSLDVARSLGLRRALVVCANTNVRSAHIIERCGGEFENIVPGPEGEGPKRRYWIDLNGWLSLP